MNLRDKKGSIAIFVLIALLFMASFLIIMFSGNINKSKVVKEQIDIIKDIYGKNTENEVVNDIYNRITSVPNINENDVISKFVSSNNIKEENIKGYKIDNQTFETKEEVYQYIENNDKYNEEIELTIITTNEEGEEEINGIVKFKTTTSIEDILVDYNGTSDENQTTKYKIDNQTFETKEEVYQYIENNDKYDEEIELTIIATNNLGNTAEVTKTVKFVKPKIETITTPIITNITPVQSSYVTYDEVDKKEETYTILDLNETYSTMTEVVACANQWLLDNKQYEVETPIKVVAKGNNNLISESTQSIKFIRGVKVTNETEFTTALASTSPSYIQLANDITCTNTISVDGVTHKLDLNNNNISYALSNTQEGSTYSFITLGTNTNLTVIDSSSEKQGSIVAEISEEAASDDINREATVTSINNRGELNIESGKIGAKVSRIITEGDKGLGVHDTGVGIKNSGTINLKGGTVYSDVVTQAFGKGAVQISEATAIGIENSGIINSTSGNIDVKAEARYLRGGIVYGRKYAYAYDIVNPSGTINNSENINFVYSATAINDDTVYEAKTRSGEIVTKIDKY